MPITALNNLTEEELQALKDAVAEEESIRRTNKVKKAQEMFYAAFRYCGENDLPVMLYTSDEDECFQIDMDDIVVVKD